MFLAMILSIIACHYWQEAACGQHARWSCAAGALGYTLYALAHALP
jgi:hypothetical protein